ncbi:GNAT family N-acetyltransferase [Nonomuraea sp. NBC_01738]|uniref:GNAT family N-acetyltransferase n=1 Tax=Nonomuraea sp. NBC_01738 TaxID=2976003 RepID=UPI002E12C056|nr:GNAT family N-acetyltransferase [Nonomuraea sp. NBC_01738]
MLRRAADADREPVLTWRNHQKVREVSFTTHEIGAGEHDRWWRAVDADDARRLLVYENAGLPGGVVSFFDHDPVRGEAMWGFYLDIDGLTARGRLLESWFEIEAEAVAYALGEMRLTTLRAEALESNRAVRALHRRYGFAETGGYDREIDGVPRPVVTLELAADQ